LPQPVYPAKSQLTGHAQSSGAVQADDGVAAAGGDLVHLGEFAVGGGEADLKALGFAGLAFALGFADADDQVVADLGQP